MRAVAEGHRVDRPNGAAADARARLNALGALIAAGVVWAGIA